MFPFTQKPLKYLYHWIAFLILLSEDKRQSIAACFVGDFDMPEVNAMYGTILTPESLYLYYMRSILSVHWIEPERTYNYKTH